MSGAELLARSAARADEKNAARVKKGKSPNQFSSGGRIASVQALRGLGRATDADDQVVFVYDDPKSDNAEHAVIRVSNGVPEEELAGVLDDVRNCFIEDASAV